jgi:hypothetical protein
MASIQPNIVDLDDLLIQIVSVNDNDANTTFVTAAPHGISLNDKVVITNCPVNSGAYNATVSAPSSTVIGVGNTTSFTIGVTSASTGGAVANTGQVMVDDVAASDTYYTPEITVDVVASTFTLNQAGNLAVAGTGVTGQALYSFFKERWKEVPSITKYRFPMLSITNEQFEFQNGWVPADDATRKKIRTAGWAEVGTGGTTNRRYSGIITLGTLGSTDQPYYTQDDSFTAATQNTTFTGPVNEAVPILMSATGTNDIDFDSTSSIASTTTDLSVFQVGDTITFSGTASGTNDITVTVASVGANALTFNETTLTASGVDSGTVRLQANRAGYFKIYVRTRGKTYADADLPDIGVTSMTTIVYRFPVSNANDLNIKTTADGAFTGAAISALSGDGTTTTVTTSVAHGLYAGAPIVVSGTGDFTAGNYTVAGVTNSTVFTIENAFSGTETIGGGESVKLQYVDAMSVTYLLNPDTSSGNVKIRGDYDTTGNVTYDVGDVVLDPVTSRWYYLDGLDANVGHVSIAADNVANAGTWTRWDTLALAAHGEREIATGTYSAFSTIYDLNSGGTSPAATKEIAYEYAQYILRSGSTIDTGTSRNGNVSDPLVYFIGSQLHTYADPTFTIEDVIYPSAVYAADIAAVDKNSITFHDWEDNLVTFPLTVLVTINFNDNLDTDSSSKYYAYYTSVPSGNFGTENAVLVKDDGNNDVFGSAFGQVDQKATFNYAYDGDTTGGRTQSTATPITVVAIGLDKAQYVVATGTITDAGATISLVSPLERNYDDPAP